MLSGLQGIVTPLFIKLNLKIRSAIIKSNMVFAQTIMLSWAIVSKSKKEKVQARMIGYRDPITKKYFRFITNNFQLN